MTAEHKEKMLRRIAHAPRPFVAFSEGKVHSTVSARHLQNYLDEMIEDGLIRFDGDLYRITAAGRASIEPVNITPPRYYGNASMKPGSLTLPKWGRETGNALIKSRTPFSGDSEVRSGEASTVSGT